MFFAYLVIFIFQSLEGAKIEPFPHWFIDANGKREVKELGELLNKMPSFQRITELILKSYDKLKLSDDILGKSG